MKRATLTCVGIVVIAVAIVASINHSDPPPPRDFTLSSAGEPLAQWSAFLEQQFASDLVCAECHPQQFVAHLRSGHSQTARLFFETPLANQLSGKSYDDPRRNQTFAFHRTEDAAFVRTNDNGKQVDFPVEWLLGSGTHASTPISIDPGSGLGVEFRWSWFASARKLDVTPDHERFDDYRPESLECFGRPLDASQSRACVNCHMTAVPPLDVPAVREAFLPNVGCERCHGPRKYHAEMAKLGRAEEVPPVLTYDDPTAYLDQCAVCHRDERNIPQNSTPATLARYQPYGLKKSLCFIESGGALTCSDCHDPHDRVSTDPQTYRRACVACHTQRHVAECPQADAGNCATCHLPKTEWHAGIAFHDHWIRIPDQPASPSSQTSESTAP